MFVQSGRTRQRYLETGVQKIAFLMTFFSYLPIFQVFHAGFMGLALSSMQRPFLIL